MVGPGEPGAGRVAAQRGGGVSQRLGDASPLAARAVPDRGGHDAQLPGRAQPVVEPRRSGRGAGRSQRPGCRAAGAGVHRRRGVAGGPQARGDHDQLRAGGGGGACRGPVGPQGIRPPRAASAAAVLAVYPPHLHQAAGLCRRLRDGEHDVPRRLGGPEHLREAGERGDRQIRRGPGPPQPHRPAEALPPRRGGAGHRGTPRAAHPQHRLRPGHRGPAVHPAGPAVRAMPVRPDGLQRGHPRLHPRPYRRRDLRQPPPAQRAADPQVDPQPAEGIVAVAPIRDGRRVRPDLLRRAVRLPV